MLAAPWQMLSQFRVRLNRMSRGRLDIGLSQLGAGKHQVGISPKTGGAEAKAGGVLDNRIVILSVLAPGTPPTRVTTQTLRHGLDGTIENSGLWPCRGGTE